MNSERGIGPAEVDRGAAMEDVKGDSISRRLSFRPFGVHCSLFTAHRSPLTWLGVGLVAGTVACQATTTRPPFGPIRGAASVVLELEVPQATTLVVEALKEDTIPVTVAESGDGYLETPWFDSATGMPTRKRPLGQDVVRVRGWVDPEKPGFSRVTVETLFREIADPSLPERELDRELPPDHTVSRRIRAVLDSLRTRYGEPDRSQ